MSPDPTQPAALALRAPDELRATVQQAIDYISSHLKK